MKTNIADTSLIAYWEQENMGAFNRLQKQILDALASCPDRDFSRSELEKMTGIKLSSVCGRVNELLDPIKCHGRVWLDELPLRKCRITGKSVHPVRIHRPVGQLQLFEVTP